ncbi:MAG: hypothetical protein J5I93_18910 [Pirellulaceae bacterium]|nr:hypothetical protein [Pirellulaceae bacterium]
MAEISETLPPAAGRSPANWLDRGLLVLVLLCCGVALSKNYADPDLWGHVTYGRDLLREGLPETATYTYTAEGHRWINHENLSEVILALSADTFGSQGLLLLKFALGLVILGLMLRYARTQAVPRPVDLVVVLLVAANLMHFWSVRPQVFSYFFFTLMIVLLNGCASGTAAGGPARVLDKPPALDRRWLWTLPVLFAVWANTHGAFVAGYALLAVYLLGRAAESVWRRGGAAWRSVAELLGVLVVTGLATGLNPYGWELHGWMLHSLGMPRPEIIEWRGPELFSVVWLPLWLMVAVGVVSLVGSRRPRDLTQLVLLALTLWQAVEHRRHIPFFAILFGFWVAPHVADFWQRIGGLRERSRADQSPPAGLRWGLGLVACLAGLLVATNLLQQLSTIPVKRNDYPVSAFEFMAARQLHGNLVVRFKWAQYAIAAFAAQDRQPPLRVAFDGRFRTCYPQEIVDMYFDFALGRHPTEPRYRAPGSPPIDGSRLLQIGEPDLALIDRQQEPAVQVMQSLQGRWVLLYQDQLAQLWGRADRYDDPRSDDYLPPHLRSVTEQPQSGIARWPALPATTPSSRLTQRDEFPARQES